MNLTRTLAVAYTDNDTHVKPKVINPYPKGIDQIHSSLHPDVLHVFNVLKQKKKNNLCATVYLLIEVSVTSSVVDSVFLVLVLLFVV